MKKVVRLKVDDFSSHKTTPLEFKEVMFCNSCLEPLDERMKTQNGSCKEWKNYKFCPYCGMKI